MLCAASHDNLFSLWCFGNTFDPIYAISSTMDYPLRQQPYKCLIPCQHQFGYQTMQPIHAMLAILEQDNHTQYWLSDIRRLEGQNNHNRNEMTTTRNTYIFFLVRMSTIFVYRALWAVYVHLRLLNLLLKQPMVLAPIHDSSFPFQSNKTCEKVEVNFRYIQMLRMISNVQL